MHIGEGVLLVGNGIEVNRRWMHLQTAESVRGGTWEAVSLRVP